MRTCSTDATPEAHHVHEDARGEHCGFVFVNESYQTSVGCVQILEPNRI